MRRSRQKKQLRTAAEDLDKKLQGLESRLVSPALRDSDNKYFIEPAEVGTGGGDIAGSADFAPTETQLELLRTYESQTANVASDYQRILQNDFPPFSQMLQRASLAPLVGGAGN